VKHARAPKGEIDLTTSWDSDADARWWVVLHPHGASQQDIAEATGLTKARIGQVERAALAKLSAWASEVSE